MCLSLCVHHIILRTTTSSIMTACPICKRHLHSILWDRLGLEVTSMYIFFHFFASKYPVSDASSFSLPTTRTNRFTTYFVVFIIKYNEIDYRSSRIYCGLMRRWKFRSICRILDAIIILQLCLLIYRSENSNFVWNMSHCLPENLCFL